MPEPAVEVVGYLSGYGGCEEWPGRVLVRLPGIQVDRWWVRGSGADLYYLTTSFDTGFDGPRSLVGILCAAWQYARTGMELGWQSVFRGLLLGEDAQRALLVAFRVGGWAGASAVLDGQAGGDVT